MTLDLSHLAGPAKEQAFQDSKARIHLVQKARWVGFSRAQMAVDELERRYHYPTCARMPCMLLYGDSGMGKTMILEKMERQHPSTLDERRQIKLRPVSDRADAAQSRRAPVLYEDSGGSRGTLLDSRTDWGPRGSCDPSSAKARDKAAVHSMRSTIC